MDDFIIIESDVPLELDIHISGIVNDRVVHIHISNGHVHYYEGTEDRLEVQLRERKE